MPEIIELPLVAADAAQFIPVQLADGTGQRVAMSDLLPSSNYQTIYTGASTSPQAFLWTVTDGSVNQTGLDVGATLGTTVINCAGRSLTGDFDLSPITSTLSQFVATGATGLVTFAPGSLDTMTNLKLDGIADLATVNLTGSLGAIDLDCDDCTSLATLTLTGCTALNSASFQNCTSLVTANFTGLTACTYLFLGGCTGLTSATFTGCAALLILNLGSTDIATLSIGDSTLLQALDVQNCALLTTLSLVGYADLTSLNLSNSGVTSFTLTGASSLTEYSSTGCTALTTVNISTSTALDTINSQGCTTLSSFTISTPSAALLTFVELTDCALDVASVNALLVALDANGLSGGAVGIAGGTSAAPTGAGITAAANLTGKGWAVATN